MLHIRWLRSALLLLVMIMPLYMVISYAVKRTYVVKVIPDNTLSSRTFREIRSDIMDYVMNSKNRVRAQELLEFIRQRYPFVDRITIRMRSSGVQTVTVHAKRPLVMVNNLHLITRDGNKILADHYIPALYENLFCLRTPSQEIDPQDVYDIRDLIVRLPDSVCEGYSCEWTDKTLLVLKDLQRPQFIIRAQSQTIFDDVLLSALERVKNYCIAKNSEIKRRSEREAPWVIDIRFKNQLILSRQKGEKGHEEGKRNS